jgi:hypothetical protein
MPAGPASCMSPVNLIAYRANIKKLSERYVSRGASPNHQFKWIIPFVPATRPKDNWLPQRQSMIPYGSVIRARVIAPGINQPTRDDRLTGCIPKNRSPPI